MTNIDTPEIISFEKSFWDWHNNLFLFDYLQPTNIATEKMRFKKNQSKGIIYNPLFTYQKPKFKFYEQIIKCNSFMEIAQTNIAKNLIWSSYIEIIDNISRELNIYSNRYKGKDISNELTCLFGCPEEKYVKMAIEFLQKENSITSSHNDGNAIYSSEQFAELMYNEIQSLNIKWHVKVDSKMSAKAAVYTEDNSLRINKNATFNKDDHKRLKVHEIETHIFRSENGACQPFLIFRYGFNNNLETEEGLASYSEAKAGVLSLATHKLYAGRLFAAYLACKHTFWEVFQKLLPYLGFDMAFTITQRVKRGLRNTAIHGGYTKDQVYFTGFDKINTFARNNDLKLLYTGIVTVEQLNIISQMKTQGIIKEPLYLPRWMTE